MYKTHTCGELRLSHCDQTVVLAGWVNVRRDHGGLIFLDLRDRFGITQVVVDADSHPDAHAIASQARSEFVLKVAGTVRERPEGSANPTFATGEVELAAREVAISIGPVKAMVRSVDIGTLEDFVGRLIGAGEHSLRNRLAGYARDRDVVIDQR